MALLAEEIVEEWLNRQGYFTIRGIKLGVDEIDIIALKKQGDDYECRHIEVTASINPVSYISKVPKAIRKATGRAPNSQKRSVDELKDGVKEFIQKKFFDKRKINMLRKLFPKDWSRELVIHEVRHPEVLNLITKEGINIIYLRTIVKEMNENDKNLVPAAAGSDLINLINLR